MTQKRDTRYFSLDMWRGIACLLIVINHSTLYLTDNPAFHAKNAIEKLIVKLCDHTWIGVPIFFVISGYCITAACDSARFKSGAVKTYFLRRFRRIFPPYWIALLLLFSAIGLAWLSGNPDLYHDAVHPVHRPSSLSVSQWFGNLTLTEMWRPHLFGDKTWFFLGPAWTLCYEEQFYAVCGLTLLLGARRFFHGLAAVTAAVALVMLINTFATPLPIVGFFFDGRWLLFAAGCLVFYRLHHATPLQAKLADAALIFACVSLVAWKFARHVLLAEDYFVGFAFAVVISYLYRWDMKIVTAPALRPFVYSGIMCYSLYLVHLPFAKAITHGLYNVGLTGVWQTMLITLPISVAVSTSTAWMFHLWVERRFLNSPPIEPWRLKRRSPSGLQGDSAALPGLVTGN